MTRETRRFLVIFHLHNTSVERVKQFAPAAKSTLDQLSDSPAELLARGISHDVFAFLIRSSLAARQIVAALESPGSGTDAVFGSQRGTWVNPFMEGGDKVIALEIGDECYANRGFNRQLGWIQHH